MTTKVEGNMLRMKDTKTDLNTVKHTQQVTGN